MSLDPSPDGCLVHDTMLFDAPVTTLLTLLFQKRLDELEPQISNYLAAPDGRGVRSCSPKAFYWVMN
jgi:hypothetical protein